MEKANNWIWIHATLGHPTAEEVVAATEIVRGRFACLITIDDPPDFFAEHRGDTLVCVELEDPGTVAGVYRVLLVDMKIGSVFLDDDRGPVALCDLDRSVGGSAVDYDNFVRDILNCFEARTEVFLFVIDCKGHREHNLLLIHR